MDMKDFLTYVFEGEAREIHVKGTFDRITLANMHRRSPFRVGDTLVSRKGERFQVSKIYPVKRYLAGKAWDDGDAIDLVGMKKGRVFTVYVR
jgi:hypothetical protein